MYEDNTRSPDGHPPRDTVGEDAAMRRTDPRTDPKTDPRFARESFTMRRMQPWQIVALAIAAAVVVGLVVFYI
jgi:hypothetical protein